MTLAVSAKGMKQDITRALNEAERGAKIAPKVDSAKLGRDGSASGRLFRSRFSAAAKLDPKANTGALVDQGAAAGRGFGERFSSAVKATMATAGIGLGIAGLAAQFKQVMSIGMDWTNTMNTLTAVTGASADELKRAGDAARALGNDVSLPATSANDAAAAMTELAKGGFSVQQAMDAAKGSLQLAAAAGISATDAATIQSQALQSFGLNADQAGKMSDTLANAANASSAEIIDVAQALQQAGTVANQFGLSAEDTASAIALLANNGIKGSDAGTLLKSSLLALTDQGNPAQGAIEQLGLTVYDATGKFVGLHSLYGQLGEAAKRMTPEQYQATTAILFGSDAMRIAGVAAKDGSASYDQMRTAIDRQGAAADVAAAKTKGLPGAWERFKNTLEDLQLQAYDKLEGPLTKLVDGVAQVPDKLSELAQNPQVQSLIADTKTAFQGLADALQKAAPMVGQIAKSLGAAAVAVGGAAWKAFVVALESVAAAVKVITPALKVIGDMMAAHQGLVSTAVGAWAAFKGIPAIMGRVTPVLKSVNDAIGSVGGVTKAAGGNVKGLIDSYRTSVRWMQQANPTVSTAGRVLFGMGGDARTASSHLRVLATNARGIASGGLNALKGAAGGVVGALGGPFSAALVIAGGAFAAISSKNDAATNSLNDYNEALKRSKEAQRDLNDALIASGGELTPEAMEKLKGSLSGLDHELTKAGDRTGTFWDQFKDESGSVWGGFKSQIFSLGDNPEGNLDTKIRMQADTAKAAQAAIDNLNLAQEELAKQVGGGQPIFDALVQNLEKQGAGGVVAAEKMKELRIDLLGAQKAGATLNPILKKIGDDVVGSASKITTAFEAVPKDVPVKVSAPGGQAVYDLLVELGEKVSIDNDKNIKVEAPLAQDVIDAFDVLGYKVRNDNGKLIVVKADTSRADAALREIVKPETKTINIVTNAPPVPGAGRQGRDPTVQRGGTTGFRMFGAIVPMADGGVRWISKPSSADIYQPRGAATMFAERETGGEAYIPLAQSKRPRSMQILMEVARRFGLVSNAEGSITVDQLKAIASSVSGNPYNWGGPASPNSDCSGVQSWIANTITGADGRFSTANQAQALLARGFQQGDPPPGVAAYWVGWRNGGPGGGHTAGTIIDPEGGNVNVEMGGRGGNGQYGGGAAGASEFPNRAWIALSGYGDDPNNVYGGGRAPSRAQQRQLRSAQQRVDDTAESVESAQFGLDELSTKENVTPKQRRDKEKALQRAQRDHQDALDDLTDTQLDINESLQKSTDKLKSGGSDGGAEGFGQSLVSGVLQGLGLDGSLFSSPLEWPNVKSGLALLNWGGGLAKAWAGAGSEDGSMGMSGGALSGIGLPNIADYLKPMPPGSTTPIGNGAHAGTGNAPGPATYDFRGANLGVSPKEFTQKLDARENAAWRRNSGAHR